MHRIISALKNNDLEFVKDNVELVRNYKYEGGSTALHFVKTNEMIQLILPLYGTDIIKRKNKYGETALHRVKTYEVAKFLTDRGVDVNCRDNYGKTPLHYVKDYEIAKLLVSLGANVNAKCYGSYGTPLLSLHSKGYRISKLLIRNGANVNYKDKRGSGVLGVYYRSLSYRTFKLYVDAGLDIHHIGRHGESTLHLMCKSSCDPQIIRSLIEKGVDVNLVDSSRKTALHYVRCYECAKILIDTGADVNARDITGMTPLHDVKDYKIAEVLINKGADVNAQNSNRMTPLSTIRNYKIAELLINRNIYKPNQLLLHGIKVPKIIKLLISKGVDVNAVERVNQNTAIFCCRSYEIMKLLIMEGADIRFRNFRNVTCFNYCDDRIKMLLVLSGYNEEYKVEDKEKYKEEINDLIYDEDFNAFDFNADDELVEHIKYKMEPFVHKISKIINSSTTISSLVLRCITSNSPFIL